MCGSRKRESSRTDGFSNSLPVLSTAALFRARPSLQQAHHSYPKPALTLLPLAERFSVGPRLFQSSSQFLSTWNTKPSSGPSSALQPSFTCPILPLCQNKRVVFSPCACLCLEAGSPSSYLQIKIIPFQVLLNCHHLHKALP